MLLTTLGMSQKIRGQSRHCYVIIHLTDPPNTLPHPLQNTHILNTILNLILLSNFNGLNGSLIGQGNNDANVTVSLAKQLVKKQNCNWFPLFSLEKPSFHFLQTVFLKTIDILSLFHFQSELSHKNQHLLTQDFNFQSHNPHHRWRSRLPNTVSRCSLFE